MEILALEVPLTCTGMVEAAMCHTTVTVVHHISWLSNMLCICEGKKLGKLPQDATLGAHRCCDFFAKICPSKEMEPRAAVLIAEHIGRKKLVSSSQILSWTMTPQQ
eukprot:6905787-Ditylum_brightwellii.AAC.1